MAEFLLSEEIVFGKSKQTPVKSLEIGEEICGQSQNNPGEQLTASSLSGWVRGGGEMDALGSKAGGCLEMEAGTSVVEQSWWGPPPPGEG